MANQNAHIVKSGDEWLPKISTYSISLEDIDSDDTTRSESGKLIRKRLRKKVIKLSITHIADGDSIAAIAQKIGDTTIELTVLCPASEEAVENYVASEFYVSKITTEMISLQGKTWWKLSYNAIEV